MNDFLKPIHLLSIHYDNQSDEIQAVNSCEIETHMSGKRADKANCPWQNRRYLPKTSNFIVPQLFSKIN